MANESYEAEIDLNIKNHLGTYTLRALELLLNSDEYSSYRPFILREILKRKGIKACNMT